MKNFTLQVAIFSLEILQESYLLTLVLDIGINIFK